MSITSTISNIEARLAAKGKAIRVVLSQADKDMIMGCLNIVNSHCDGARNRDNTGFCRNDLRKNAKGLITWLSKDSRLTFNGYEWALQMCVYYQRQWLPYMPTNTLVRVKKLQADLPLFWQ